MRKLGLFDRFDVIISFGCLLYCAQLIQCHRSDVYIAGFFPYGAGKENSETGEFLFDKNQDGGFVVKCAKEKKKNRFECGNVCK